MHSSTAISLAGVVVMYLALQFLLHITQNGREPRLLESNIPFFDSAIGILKHRAEYFSYLRSVE
jgi:hypothetical protein